MVQKRFKVRPVFRFSLKLKKKYFPTDTWRFLDFLRLHMDTAVKGALSTPDGTEEIQANGTVLPLQVPTRRVRGPLTAGL